MKLKSKFITILITTFSITSCGNWREPLIIHSSEETARIYQEYTSDQYVTQYVDNVFNVDSWGDLLNDSQTREKFNFKEYNPYEKHLTKVGLDSFAVTSRLSTNQLDEHVWINEIPGVQKTKLNEITTKCNDYIYFDQNGTKQIKTNMPHINKISMHYISKAEVEQLHNDNISITGGNGSLTNTPLLHNFESHISLSFHGDIHVKNNATLPWLMPDGKCNVFGWHNYDIFNFYTTIKTTVINYIITKTKIYQIYFDDYYSAISENNNKLKVAYDLNELKAFNYVEVDRQDGLMAIKDQINQAKDLLVRDRTKKIDINKTDAFINDVRPKYFEDIYNYSYGVKDEDDYIYGILRYVSTREQGWQVTDLKPRVGLHGIEEWHLLNNNAESPLLNWYSSGVTLKKI